MVRRPRFVIAFRIDLELGRWKMETRRKNIFILGIFSLVALSCTEPKELSKRVSGDKKAVIGAGGPGNGGNPGNGGQGQGSMDFPYAESLQFFQSTVHPVVRSTCAGAGCHSTTTRPLFSLEDAASAQENLVGGGYVDFIDLEASTIYERIAVLSHNCGNCEATGQAMLAALMSWRDSLNGVGYTPAAKQVGFQSAEVGFDAATEPEDVATNDTFVVLSIEECGNPASTVCQLTAPMVYNAEEKFVEVPDGTNGLIGDPNTGGRATFNFEIPATGDYVAFAYANAPNNASNSAFISIDNSAFAEWHIGANGADYDYVQVANGANNPTLINYPNLAAGNHTFTLNQREDGTRFKGVVIAPVGTVAEELGAIQLAPQDKLDLSFDVSALVPGANARLIAAYRLVNEETKAISFTNLRIETDTPLRIKSIRPLINGKSRAEYSTYISVDMTVPVGRTLISNSDLRILGEKGVAEDKIAFYFDEIAIAN